MDILSATILECLNTTLSEIYSVQLHLCPWCSKDQPVLVLVWLRQTILGPGGPKSGKARISFAPHPQEVNYLAGKEVPSSVLINYLWRYNYSEYIVSASSRPEAINFSMGIHATKRWNRIVIQRFTR